MANFANLTAQLNLNIQNFAQNMQKAATLANRFASNLQGQINAGMVDPTKKAKFEFKDVARIVQGIIVSKIFYSSLNAIRRATDAVWEFSKELEYAKMVYSNLFGDTDLAQEFINVLKDFAAVTPFSFKQAENAAKRLLAYGIESKNVMFMMQGVLSAATVQGTDAVIEPISRAMGQIYTKGRLMNEEMRQLAEAGIPVYEILQEKLNLTAEELRNLGRTAIPASTALNALVEGINERFGSTLELASSTTQGIISNIVDNSIMLFAGIFEPFTEYLRGALGRFGEFINELRSIYELKGIGGVFEKLIPPALQQDIKVLIANLKILWDIIKSTLVAAFKILGSLLRGLLHAFNALAPAIYTVVGTLAGLLKVITSNEKLMKGLTTAILAAAAAWVVYKIQAVAASISTVVIKGIVGAIKVLVAAMNFVVAHPIWALLALGVSIFIALTGASDKFRDSINKLFSGFTKLSGMDPNKMLLPDSKSRASDLDKFNEALSDTSKFMDDVAEAAAKAGKNLMSFDEVFTIDQSKDNEDVIPDMPDIAGAFKGFEMPDIGMELPDVGGIATNFVDNLIEALGGKDKLLGAGIGSLLGAAIGMIIGGPGGALIGGGIGLLVGWFVNKIAEALETGDWSTVALAGGTGLGAAIGMIIGGPGGALIGGGIGLLVGWFVNKIAEALETGDWSTVALAGGTGLGAAIGMIIGGPGGALIGGGIGLLVGWFVNKIAEALETGDWSTVALAGGTGLGAAIGMIIGGPGGALIGGGIGLLVGWFVNKIAEALETGDWSTVALAGGTGLGAAIGMIIGGPGGALIGGGIGLLVGWFVNKIAEALETGDWSTVALAGGTGLGAAIGMIIGGPGGALIGGGIGLLVGWFVNKIAEALETGDWSTVALAGGTGLGAAIGMIIGGPGGALIGGGIGLLVGWFVNKIAEALETGDWSTVALAGGTGLGAAIGMIIGGPGGALIGGGIGLLVGWFVNKIAEALETGDWSTVALAGGTGLGAAIGMIIGGPGGALIGGGIGLLVGWFVNKIAEALETGDWSTVALAGGTGLGAAIGMIIGGPGGALIGGGIGLLVGWFVNKIAEALETGDWSTVALAGGTGLGAAIGMIIGGPGGALIGGGIGLLVGWFVNKIAEALETGDWSTVALAGGTGIGAAIGFIVGGPVGALIGSAIGRLVGWLIGLIIENWDSIVAWFDEAAKKIGDFFQGIWDTIKEKVRGAWGTVTERFQNIWDTIKEKVSGARDTTAERFQNIWDTIKEKVSGARDTIAERFQNIWDTISEKVNGARDTTAERFQNIWDTISEKVSGARGTVTERFQNIWDIISEKVSGARGTVTERFQNIWDTISEKVSGARDTTTDVFQGIWDTIKEKVSGARDITAERFQNIWDTISEKLFGSWDSVSEAFSGIYDTISEKISGMYNSVKDGIKNIYRAFKDWIGDMWNNIFNKLFGWIDNAINKLKDFFRLDSQAKNTSIPTRDSTTVTSVTTGHAIGGIFNREHIARIAEGNRAEAVIPLENQNAMQPFADAIANGVASVLLPIISSMNNQEQVHPIYVNTLIADDRGLKELERKLQIIRLSENSRRGS